MYCLYKLKLGQYFIYNIIKTKILRNILFKQNKTKIDKSKFIALANF